MKKKVKTPKKRSRPKAKSRQPVKPKVGFYWGSACGGCDEAIVDLEENILQVVAAVDIVFWPCAMDYKLTDLAALADAEMAVAFINGAIRNSEQEEVVKLIRKKSALVIAFGMCAYQGGIPALANLTNKTAILERAYRESESTENPAGIFPAEKTMVENHELTIPHFYDTVYKLDDIIAVDYYLPGCPPTFEIIQNALTAILSGKLPPKGTVLAANRSVCHSCERNATKPDQLSIPKLKRIHEVTADNTRCFLAQGILCMGPATRDGCQQLCIKGYMPCTGCFGPLQNNDQGARMLSALAGLGEAETQEQLQSMMEGIPDPAGTFYRYGLSGSILGRKRDE
jgi:F420-non-reducing hydrogenase small subunit